MTLDPARAHRYTARRRTRADHDGGFHLLFSHTRLIHDLLVGFIDEPWVDRIDLGTLERVNAKLHAGTLRRADGDMVWRVRLKRGGYAYLYVLLEFQSTSDRWMAVRMAAAVLLLYLHLIREHARNRPEAVAVVRDGKLPPVFPLVLYNGTGAWTAACDVADLVALPRGLDDWSWRPSLRYHVLGSRDQASTTAAGSDNLVAILFDLERCRTADEVATQVGRLADLLQGEDQAELQRAFVTWIVSVLAVANDLPIRARHVERLSEFKPMLRNLGEHIRKDKEKAVAAATKAGKAQALIHLVEKRFGPLVEDRRRSILAADADAIEAWFDRAIDAADLDAVFAEPIVN